MSRFFKWKKKNLLCFLQIDRRACGKNGDSQSVHNGFFDTFQVIHAGNHIEVTGCNTEFFQKDIHFLLSAGTFFTDNDRIFHKILKGDCMILHFQIMLGYRGCNDKFILTERKKDTALIAGILSNQRQVHSAVKDAVDGLCTICLDRVKISIRVRFSVGSQDFSLNIPISPFPCGSASGPEH